MDYRLHYTWQAKYLHKLKDKHLLAWSDAEAIYKYPQAKWVYDKYKLHQYLGMVNTYDLWENFPQEDEFPQFVRPRTNMLGMSRDTQMIHSKRELFEKGLIGSYISQPVLEGHQFTYDLVWSDRKLVDWFGFLCRFDENGSFDLFMSVQHSLLPPELLEKLSRIGQGRRVMNIEMIGGYPVELHLRPSVQFYDISGGLLEQLPKFIMTGKWEPVKREWTYSRIFRQKKDRRMVRPRNPPKPRKGVRSIQYCWENGQRLSEHSNDSHTYRYLVVNGTDLYGMEQYGQELKRHIKIYP